MAARINEAHEWRATSEQVWSSEAHTAEWYCFILSLFMPFMYTHMHVHLHSWPLVQRVQFLLVHPFLVAHGRLFHPLQTKGKKFNNKGKLLLRFSCNLQLTTVIENCWSGVIVFLLFFIQQKSCDAFSEHSISLMLRSIDKTEDSCIRAVRPSCTDKFS